MSPRLRPNCLLTAIPTVGRDTCGSVNLLDECFAANRRWAENTVREDPQFFERLANLQNPDLLWIGCSDSRLPPNEIIGRAPGELFVHRNVANVVVHTDLNCLSVLQYAVDALRVRHIIVCGHYGCGGVRAALAGTKLGLIDNWLRHVQDVNQKHAAELNRLTPEAREDRLCELNALEQAVNVCGTTIVQDAWERGQALTVHAWVYRLDDGILRDLQFDVDSNTELLRKTPAR